MLFGSLDMNLLIALDALLSEGNVTRAAERLNVSQPTMSTALSKLRWYFKDPLLERVGRGLEPTARANELREPVREMLLSLEKVLERQPDFDPMTANRTYRVAMSPYCATLLGKRLIRGIIAKAPHVRCEFENISGDLFTRLHEAQLDCAIALDQRLLFEQGSVQSSLHEMPLFSDRMVLVCDRDHPTCKEDLDLEGFAQLDFIETSFSNRMVGMITHMIRRLHTPPKEHAVVPNAEMSLQLVSGSNLVTIVPKRLAKHYIEDLGLRMVELPVQADSFQEVLLWHSRHANDPGQIWFRRQIKAACEDAIA